MPKHSPEEKARALGALYASAELIGADLVPNFHSTARRIGIDHQTLMRWWKGRDASADVQFRAAAARARDRAAEDGAGLWLREQLQKLKQRHKEILDDDDRWGKAEIDAAARAAKTIGEGLAKLDALLNGNGPDQPAAGGSDPGALSGAVDRALARAAPGGAHGGDPGTG